MNAALARLERIATTLDPSIIAETKMLQGTQMVSEQPWFIAGVSDGMGLHTAIAAIEAGAMKRGVGVYWEPPHLLETGADGLPVSPIHAARVEHANALSEFAARRGVDFKVVFANCVLAPERDLKGNPKGNPTPLPQEITDALGRPTGDLVFINSVAFGKWMCPREGAEAKRAPMLGFDGSITWGHTKPFHVRGYQETLDTMGRNHGWMLDALKSLGHLGPRSLSAFFTWAGGSQRVSSLEGIYGKGALGDAKLLAEADIARRRLDEDGAFGRHAIVRLPAFLSAALMGIPGGGFFGMISRRILESNGCFEGMPELAGRMVREFFGTEWLSENPISQIELDHAECLHLDTINAAVAEGTRRLAAAAQMPSTLAETATLLKDLFPPRFEDLLAAMIPSQPDRVEVGSVDISSLQRGLPDELLARVGMQATNRTHVIFARADVVGTCRAEVYRFGDAVVVQVMDGDRWVASAVAESVVVDVRPEDLGTPVGVVRADFEGLPVDVLAQLKLARAITIEWDARRPSQAMLYSKATEGGLALTWVDEKAHTCGRVTTHN
ncbi:MAG: hypothetical protein R3E66_00930 [bacterium]